VKFVANRINGVHLRDLLPPTAEENQVDFVKAAVAYGSSSADELQSLVGHSVKNRLRLDLWMRYDETVPVAVPTLRKLLRHQSDNVFTKFIPDCFHPKIIWWKGYGAYIGSANLTDRGWLTNIEAGVFISEAELVLNGLDLQIEEFFEYLEELELAFPISEEYIKEMERLNELNKAAFNAARNSRSHKIWDGPSFVTKLNALERGKAQFKREWLSTLGTLKMIEQQILDFRPRWVSAQTPTAWQVDQFLHAFYYNRVGDHSSKPYEDYHQRNKPDPMSALMEQLLWWASLPEAPSHEDRHLDEWAPLVQKLLSRESIGNLTETQVKQVCERTHATRDHVIKISTAELVVLC
jgi:PLD-like domain